ncbi:ABC transporter ATP-binding protein [Mycobacteroides abscessus subsp. abscessus]|nr:ABC transporter ATP-binding protein [Mycobacteroides abscessus subsp. abscessus]
MDPTAPGALRARVANKVWRGASTRVSLAVSGLPDQLIDAEVPGHADVQPDSVVGVKFPEPAGALVAVPGEV